ncbi:hypothetical protein F5Y00DRAFT_244641 [Daldinia vernicosa]|uniref:uncharacterized protein n=1 Tax=Daldinia vernicosa TaxID=114800 RepID=UPI002007406F|nr:uncharacterized protein F5Y00DRAFT_244641 [Daldinia vernicosa]KAI0846137.1 hypothetical protein F5Y00DRAFT_244641 [Daldinia vernicosa]
MGENNEFRDSDCRRAEVPDYIAARRERGKLAQRAFRQRQIDTIRSLEEENRKLRRAISAISDAADRNDATISQAIAEARKVAGITTPEAKRKQPAPVIPDLNSSSWSSITPIEATPVAAPASSQESSSLDDFSLASFQISDQANSWSQFLSMTSSDAYDLTTNINDFDGGLGLSMSNPDYLGGQIVPTGVSTAFEPDRAIHIADPPPDIIPYMGDKAYTLAGQIYWAALAFGFQALRAIISSATPPPVAVDIITNQWCFTSKRLALPQIMRLMYARLTFRRYGYFHLASDKHREEIKSFLDPNLGKRLSIALCDEANKDGFRKADFLSPLDFERELRERFRDDYPIFEAALRGQALDQEHVACMRKLIQLMSRQAVCFGDGPRWRPESVDTLVDGWKMSTRPFAVH